MSTQMREELVRGQKAGLMRFIAISFCCMTYVNACCAATSPNFVIFYVDDLGWADTSVRMMDDEPLSRSDFNQTPALEELARQGVRFTSGYAPTPTCTGSRISIQFGMTSARLQYRNVFDVLSKKQRAAKGWDEEISMAGVLKAANKGYVTAHFGKGMNVRRMDHAGYDVSDEFDRGSNGNGHGRYNDVKKKIPIPDDNPKRIVDLTKRSVDFVKEHAGERPFFLMVSHYAVHVPHQASPEAIERCRRRWLAAGKPDIDRSQPGYEQTDTYQQWEYSAMLKETDQSLGSIIDALVESGQFDNTYVVFTSDNGGDFYKSNANHLRCNGPLREGKGSTFEGGIRVPFVVSGPGIKPGSQCAVPVIQWDLLPTLHDLADSQTLLPAGVDGGSLRGVFESGDAGSVRRNALGLVFHYTCHFHPPVSAIRIGDHKLLRHLASGELRLFDVAKDYAEKHDLSGKMPQKVAEMDRIRQQYVQNVDGGTMPEVYEAYSDWMGASRKNAEQKYDKDVASLKERNPVDLVKGLAKLKSNWEKSKRSYVVKRALIEDHMQESSWYRQDQDKVIKRLGMDKQGNLITPDP
ncbi:MAG: sulfatase [Fuerstiella sp.]|nr:sulfatase [Fuerstiella sp.]